MIKDREKGRKNYFSGRREALTALNEDNGLLGCHNLQDLHSYHRVVETAASNFTIF
jgi:hypothetical protein